MMIPRTCGICVAVSEIISAFFLTSFALAGVINLHLQCGENDLKFLGFINLG